MEWGGFPKNSRLRHLRQVPKNAVQVAEILVGGEGCAQDVSGSGDPEVVFAHVAGCGAEGLAGQFALAESIYSQRKVVLNETNAESWNRRSKPLCVDYILVCPVEDKPVCPTKMTLLVRVFAADKWAAAPFAQRK